MWSVKEAMGTSACRAWLRHRILVDQEIAQIRSAGLIDNISKHIDMFMSTDFTPFLSLGGGLLIGLSAVLAMAFLGRIMGATGILAGFLTPSSGNDWSWRAAMVAGMISAPLGMLLVTGQTAEITVPVSLPMLLVGGFLVGVGVTYGGGCTSGHGVCGLARFSNRSLVATVTFMATAFATVFVVRHVVVA